MPKKITLELFIEKSNIKHNFKYTYTKSVYKGMNSNVIITCPIHGDFEQLPSNHISGKGCRKCSGKEKLTIKTFIDKANKVHDNKYDYSLAIYLNNHTKIKIICPIHGEFEQAPNHHIKGQGCPSCINFFLRKKFSMGKEIFIEKSNKIHNNKYDYSKVEYVNSNTKVTIICPVHGEFEQIPYSHMIGRNCIKCGREKTIENQKLNVNDFIERSNKIHDNKYDYSKVDYTNYDTPIVIICPIHGEFEQIPDKHLQGHGCRKCSNTVSSQEKQICDFLKENNIKYVQSDREIISPLELDIVIPEHNLAIEFCGQYWHSEQVLSTKNKYNPKAYHKLKYDLCKEHNIQLLTIFESEWINKSDIIKSIILAKCNIYKEKIGARTLNLKKVNLSEAKIFFNENHIQGYTNGEIIGLYKDNDLISAIIFTKNTNVYHLSRFVNKKNMLIHGAFSKLLKYSIKELNINIIETFADNRYFSGNVYIKSGFKFNHYVDPRYYYFKGDSGLIHRRSFQKNKLIKKLKNYDLTLTEYENALNHGYDRIWDCGKIKYSLTI